MRHGSLFSGIGGFDLAAEWMGWENVFHCEWNPFGQRVLKHYWPNAETFTDITKTDFTKYANTVDIISGGFPCQPFSLAGKRKGTDDERYLWGEMLRAIQEIKPRFVIAENVFGITNIDGGLVFQQVCLDLEAEGYEVQPFIIPACAKNAPHRRDRCWFIGVRNAAYSERSGGLQRGKNIQSEKPNGQQFVGHGWKRDATDASSWGIQGHGGRCENGEFQTNEFNANNRKRQPRMDWQKFPTQSPICGGDDGLSRELDGITFSKWRAESVKAYGNAIVPQVAYEIFKAITKTI